MTRVGNATCKKSLSHTALVEISRLLVDTGLTALECRDSIYVRTVRLAVKPLRRSRRQPHPPCLTLAQRTVTAYRNPHPVSGLVLAVRRFIRIERVVVLHPGPRGARVEHGVERVLSSNIYRLRYAPLYAANLLTANLVCACVRAAHGRGPRRPGF